MLVVFLILLIYLNALVSSAKITRTEFANRNNLFEQQQRNHMMLLESREKFQEKLKAGNFQLLTFQDLQQIIINKIHQSEILILDERTINSSPPGIRLILEADYLLLSEFISWELLQAAELLQFIELELRRNDEVILLDLHYELAEDVWLPENYLSGLKTGRSTAANETAENLTSSLNVDLQNFLKFRLSDGGDLERRDNYSSFGSDLPVNTVRYQYRQPEITGVQADDNSRAEADEFSFVSREKLSASISWRGFISGIEEDLFIFETLQGSLVLASGDSITISESGRDIKVKLIVTEKTIYFKAGDTKYLIAEL